MKDREQQNDIRQKVNMYLDKELSPKDETELLSKADTDPTLGRQINQEKEFRDYIKTAINRPSVSPDLIKSIRDNIKRRG